MNAPLECTGYIESGQATDYRATYAESGDAREAVVRYYLHLDRSYANQSRATAEAWSSTELKWNQIAYLLPGEWAEHCTRAMAEQIIDDALDSLRALVIPLLAL